MAVNHFINFDSCAVLIIILKCEFQNTVLFRSIPTNILKQIYLHICLLNFCVFVMLNIVYDYLSLFSNPEQPRNILQLN
jgi:hypothetical protein